MKNIHSEIISEAIFTDNYNLFSLRMKLESHMVLTDYRLYLSKIFLLGHQRILITWAQARVCLRVATPLNTTALESVPLAYHNLKLACCAPYMVVHFQTNIHSDTCKLVSEAFTKTKSYEFDQAKPKY